MANPQSDAQGLQNLLQSIAPDAVDNVTPEALQRLTEKLSELMGEDVVRTAFSGADQGLPLVDITDGGLPKASHDPRSLVEEPPLVPLSSLSASTRAKNKRERDHILDLLEQEEEEEQRKTDERERLERQAALEKRKEASRGELDKLKMVKETHKKMGKALMRSMAEARETQEVKAKEEIASVEAVQKAVTSNGTKKKTVTFADAESPSTSSNGRSMNWGDVAKGKLRSVTKPDLPSNGSERLMKKNVVERFPGSGQPSTQPAPQEREADSDDESEPDIEDDDSDADQDLEEDEFDLDYALHQREIALAYQEKREKIGEEATIALTSHTHDPDEDPTQKSKSKTPVSKFRANRLASAYVASSPSQSISASVVPVAGADTLQRAIRMGNIDQDGRLVGGEHESEEEDNAVLNEQENEAVQEVLDLLTKGQVYNAGPEGELHTVSPERTTTAPFTMPTEPPPSARQKEKAPSKFKLARGGATSSPTSETSASGSSTPISNLDRSSPKLPGVFERAPPSPSPLTAATVVESPSFTGTSAVIESPSFPSRAAKRPERPPAVMASAVKEREIAPGGRLADTQQPPSSDESPKRVSRFKAERM
ncbi:hypothetical protein PQX77_001826 [Marasmius sp. AFHP31]|nr:hypothetical protein PQX77_001826 [Marasmius sp. AFHP31]